MKPGAKIQFTNITGKDIDRIDPEKIYTYKSQKNMFGKTYWYVEELEKPVEVRTILSDIKEESDSD